MTADLSVLLDQLKASIEEGEWFGGHEAAALADVAAAAEEKRACPFCHRYSGNHKQGVYDHRATCPLDRLRSVLAGEEEA